VIAEQAVVAAERDLATKQATADAARTTRPASAATKVAEALTPPPGQ